MDCKFLCVLMTKHRSRRETSVVKCQADPGKASVSQLADDDRNAPGRMTSSGANGTTEGRGTKRKRYVTNLLAR